MKKKKIHKCEHKNRKNVHSSFGVNSNCVTVQCTDCGWYRYEDIDIKTKGKSESEWRKEVHHAHK